MKIYLFLVLFCIYITSPTIIQATSSIFSDEFNEGLNKWSISPSDTSYWTISDGTLAVNINKPFMTSMIKSVSELNLNCVDGYAIEFNYNHSQGTDLNFIYSYTDERNWSEIHIAGANIFLGDTINGFYSDQFIASNEDVSYGSHKVSIKLLGNQLQLKIDDTTITDSYVSNCQLNKFVLRAGTGTNYPSTTSFDNILVTTDDADPVDERLGVVRVGQGDDPWGPMEYDNASTWSDGGTTFKDWACALTSAVMIMRYHGITQMPDGTDVNPLTVNNWLLANNGYVNGGLVSFSSISALTKMISAQYATPTLEYSRINENPVAEARLAAANGQPMIVQLPGHFVVSNGSVTSDENDLYIQDPASQKEQLSQLNTTPVSVRRLAPSNVSQRLAIAADTVESDVSFLEITADPMTVVTITDAAGNPIAVQPVTDQITNANDPSQVSPAVQLIEIPRPGAGSYVVTTNDSAETKLPTTVKTIAKDGSNNVYEIPEGKQTTHVRIAEDGTSVFETEDKIGFSSLRKLLRELRDSGAIKKERPYQLLDLIASYGESSSEPTEQRLVVAILRKVTNNYNTKSGMTREARKTILAQLEQMSKQLKSFSQKPISTAKPTPTIQPSPTAKPSPTMLPKKGR